MQTSYLQEALSVPVEPYGDHPVAGAFFAPDSGAKGGSGQIVVGLREGPILYWGGHKDTRSAARQAKTVSAGKQGLGGKSRTPIRQLRARRNAQTTHDKYAGQPGR